MSVMNVHIVGDEKVIFFVVAAGFTLCHCLGLCFILSVLLYSLLAVDRRIPRVLFFCALPTKPYCLPVQVVMLL